MLRLRHNQSWPKKGILLQRHDQSWPKKGMLELENAFSFFSVYFDIRKKANYNIEWSHSSKL